MADGPRGLVATNPGGLVYGTILVATLLAAESAANETYVKTIGAVLVALALYWLAMGYAEFTAHRAEHRGHGDIADYLRALRHEIAVVYGELGPLAALVICWAIGARLSTAVSAAVWTAVAIVIATELLIGVRSDLHGRELVVQSAFGIVLGLAIVGLRVVLHH